MRFLAEIMVTCAAANAMLLVLLLFSLWPTEMLAACCETYLVNEFLLPHLRVGSVSLFVFRF